MRKLTLILIAIVTFSCSDDSMDIPDAKFRENYAGKMFEGRYHEFKISSSITIGHTYRCDRTYTTVDIVSESEHEIVFKTTYLNNYGDERFETIGLKITNFNSGDNLRGLIVVDSTDPEVLREIQTLKCN